MSSGPPDADTILNRDGVENGTFADIASRGVRGMVYGIGLFLISLVTGVTDVVQKFFTSTAGGVAGVFDGFFSSIALLITEGAARTTSSFLLPAPWGWVEGLAWVIAGAYLIRWAMSTFSTDLFFLPGFDIIPVLGQESDEEEESDS